MQAGVKQFSGFVSGLNERARYDDAQALSRWGVEALADTIGFDCAWYGWALLNEQGPQIHAQSVYNLPEDYYASWCNMSEQDVLAAAHHNNQQQPVVYDRFGITQTDGMITLSDDYGLTRMTTAMQYRSGRGASFFLSGYRGGSHSRKWSRAELDFLQCAVEQLSCAMSVSAEPEIIGNSMDEHSLLVAANGIGILGVNNAREKFGALWPDWHGDQLPDQLCNLLGDSGEHVLVDRQLVVTCELSAVADDKNLRKLSLRRLSKFDLLTEREKEVAGLLADGNSHKEVARLLTVAPATVRNQTQSIYTKLHVNSRAALAKVVNDVRR